MTQSPIQIQMRKLDPATDFLAVCDLCAATQEYWHIMDGAFDPANTATEFFHDVPPGADIRKSHHIGLFYDGRLNGIAELSFGFPTPDDGYIGLMILVAELRGGGVGPVFLTHLQSLAIQGGAAKIYLAVREINPRAAAFWRREGFTATGLSGVDPETGQILHRMEKRLLPAVCDPMASQTL
jgi:GNAT superfamily N-acetyltransferase